MKKRTWIALGSAFLLIGCGTTTASSAENSADSSIAHTSEVKEQKFTITYDCQHCQLSAIGYATLPTEVKDGDVIIYTLTVDNGYQLSAFKVNDNAIVPTNGGYNVTFHSNTTIKVETQSNVTVIDNEFESSLETPTSYEITQHSYHTENLPVINIDTENSIALDDESLQLGNNKGMHNDIMEYDYANCTVNVTNCEDHELTDISGKVKIRGNYTSTYEKRPLRIKFDKKQNMCGLNGGQKFKNWVLLAEYTDGSLLKNSVTEYLGKTMLGSDGEYSTDFRFVEVYLNGSYNGVYNLVEQQEVKEGRLDIPEALDPEDNADKTEEELKDTHIGYFLEYDGYYANEAALQTFTLNYPSDEKDLYGNSVSYQQPGFTVKNDLFYQEQNDYIKKTTQAIYDIVYDATNKSHNPVSEHPFYTLQDGEKVIDTTIKTPREAIEKVIDVDSLLDMFFIEEIAEDTDLDWSSFYMYIDMSDTGDHKLHYCAPWDFDNGFSATSFGDEGNIFYTMKCTGTTGMGGMNVMHNNANPWLITFANEEWFWALAKSKWNAHKDAGTFTNAIQMIDDYYAAFSEAYSRNAEKWPSCYSSQGTIPGGGGDTGGNTGGSNAETPSNTVDPSQKVSDLKSWTQNRVNVLDTLFSQK